MPLVIAIDGPAAAGKGTLARKLATHFAIPHLDTGLTYRATAKALLDTDKPLDDEAVAADAAAHIDLGALDRDILSAHEIGEAASKVAAMPAVRVALVAAQRRFAESGRGAVLDGRDIGTVVCPNARVKLYVTADAETRARRRYDEIVARGGAAEFSQILEDVKRRDERDMSRKDSPLRPADDAHLLDTSKMGIEAAFQAALAYIEERSDRN